MPSFRFFIIASATIVWLLTFTGSGVNAQQPVNKAGPIPTNSETPIQSPTPNPNPNESAPAEKSQNERLTFMADSERELHDSAPSTGGLMLRTLGALLLIVGLIVAVAWTMKRLGGARFGAPKENAPELMVLNSLSLGDKRALAIVRFSGRTLLLGSTPQSVTLLAETEFENINVPRPRSVAELLSDDQPEAFAAELLTATQRLGGGIESAQGESV